MAMARSSLNGMWNYSCEGGTYLYTQAKMGAAFMFQTWRRGLICLLVLASLPFLAPVILVSMMVGGIFLVPFLCGVTAYYGLFHPASLSNIIKWFCSPKSVQSRSTELVMEDLDVHDDGNRDHGASLGISNLDRQSTDQERLDIDSEYVIVANEADQSEPQEIDVSSSPLNASEVEIEASGLTSPGAHSTADEIVEESNAFEAVQKNEEEDKVTALVASKCMQDDEVATSGVSASEGSIKDIEEEPHHNESVVDFSSETPLALESHRQLDGHEEVEGEEMVQGRNQRGQEREEPTSSAASYREPVEEEDPAHESASIATALEHSLPVEESLGSEAILEELNKDVADPSNAGRAGPEKEDSALGVLSSKELAEEESHAPDSDDTNFQSYLLPVGEEERIKNNVLVDEEILEDKDVVLPGRDERGRGEAERPSDSLLSQKLVQEKSLLQENAEHSTDYSYPVAENQDLKSEEAEDNAFHFDDQEREPGEDQVMSVDSPDKDSLEDVFPILGITASGIPFEELNLPADELKPAEEGGKREVVVLDSQQSGVGEEEGGVEEDLNDAHFDPNRPLVPEEHPEQILGSETIAREVDGSDTDKYAVMHMVDKLKEEDNEIANDRGLNESELPAFEHVKTGTTADHQDLAELKQLDEPKRLEEGLVEAQSASEDPTAFEESESFVESKAVEGKQGEGNPADQLKAQRKEHEYLDESVGVKEVKEEPFQVQLVADKQQEQMEEPEQLEEGSPEAQPTSEDSTAPVDHLEESNAGNDELREDYSGAGHPVIIAREQQQLEEPKGLKEGTTEAQPASEDSTALGEPEHFVESEAVEEKEDEGHPGDQLTPGKEQERFDEYEEENKESGQPVSASTQPLVSEGKLVHSEHGLPLKHVVQQVDETDAIEGDSELYNSAADSFSPSENEQEQVDVIETNARELNEDTAHGLAGNTQLNLKGAVSKENVPLDEVEASVVQEKEVERPVSELVSEKEAPGVEEEAEAAPALDPEAPVIEEKPLPLEEAAPMDEVAPVEVAAPVEEAVAKKTAEPESQVIEEKELETPAPEVVKEVGAPVAEDVSIVEPEVTKEPDAEPAAPQVVAKDGAPIVQEKEVEPPLVVSEPVSEEREAPVVEEEGVPAPSLGSEVPVMEQHSLPVDSEPMELASPVADVPAIAEAARTEVVALVEDSDANAIYVQGAPVVEEREVKGAAPMEDVIAEGVEESEAPVLEEKRLEAFVEEAAAPETVTSEANACIAEPEVTKEVEVPEAPMVEEKEKADPLLESSASILDQQSLPVDSEPVESASSVDDVPAIEEAAPVQEAAFGEAAASVEESDAKKVEVPEAPMVEEKEKIDPVLEPSASTLDQQSLPVDSEPVESASSVDDVPAIAEPVPVQEAATSVEESDAKEVELPEAPMVEEEEKVDPVLESSASALDQQSLPVDSEPVESASSVEDVSAIAEVAAVQEAAFGEAAASVEESDVKEVEVPEAPMVEKEVEASVEDAGTSESDALIVEPGVAKEAATESAAPQVVGEEEAPIVQMKEVEPSLVASELVSEEKEVPVVEEKDVPAPSLESEVPVMEQHSLPVVSEPVELASPVADVPSIEEVALMEEAAPVGVAASADEDPETPVVEDKEIKAPVAAPEEVIVEEPPVVVAPAQEGAAPEAEALIAEPELTKEVKDKPAASEAVEEDGDVELPSVVSEPVTEEKEAPDVAEEAEAAPILESGALVVEEKSLLEEEAALMGVAASVEDFASIEEAAPVEVAAPVGEGVVQKGEESETPVVDVKAPVDALQEVPVTVAPAEERPALEAEVPVADPEVTKKAGPAAPEIFSKEDPIVQDEVELPLVVPKPVAEEAPVVPGVEEALFSTGSEPEAPVIAEKSLPAEEAAQVEKLAAVKVDQQPEPPVVEEKEVEAHVAKISIEEENVDEAPEAEAPVNDPEVTKDVEAELAAPAFIAEEDAPDVQEVELHLAVSELVSEEKEAPGVEKEAPAVPGMEPETPVVAEKSLPVQEVKAAPVGEALVNQVGEPAVEKIEAAHDTALHISSQVDSDTSSEATGKTISPPGKEITDGFKSEEDGAEDFTRSEANVESGSREEHDRIAPNLDPPSNVEESTPADENLNQASKDRSVKVSNLELEDAPLISASSITAQLGEQGKEADEDVQKLEEIFDKDKAVESRTEQVVFPTLKPLNVAQSKESSHHEQPEESDSISTNAPIQRRISFENVRADEEANLGAPSLPNQRTGVQGTNFVFKSRVGRDHRTHRHSAPDFLATHTWVREAPLYSPQDNFRGHKKAKYKKWSESEGARVARSYSASVSDSTEPHMGEFENLLQSWQERDKATHSSTRTSPSGSLRSPAEIGRQIREEISTIQKIIGQEIPPQYSLWKEVETLCQIVGMELPYMGDVSDLTKARHGLDLLKVVVGIKWT